MERWMLFIAAPLLVVNSEEFTRWVDFGLLPNVVEYAISALIFLQIVSVPSIRHLAIQR